MQKWGKSAAGTQRYICHKCKQTRVRTRPNSTKHNHFKLYLDWLSGKTTLDEFGVKHGVSRRTLGRWFKPFHQEEIFPDLIKCRGQVIIADGYFVHRQACVLITILTTNQPVTWYFTQTENTQTWLACFSQIKDAPLAIVLDGKAGSIKAAKFRWPRILVQRCQFHVIHYVNSLLTKNPEIQAARDFKRLIGKITSVRSLDQWKWWVEEFKDWYLLYGELIKERTYREALTPTGRHKWHYTHGRLHAAFSHVKNAFAFLFVYLKYPQIPNTSNRIEGSINASLQRLLDAHRGQSLLGQRQLISAFLKSKQ